MKVRIITGRGWYMSYINNVFDVDKEKENGYLVTSIGGWRGTIRKEDAEVVEEEKSCETCNLRSVRCVNVVGKCDENSKWQPIEPPTRETADPSKIVRGSEQREKLIQADNKMFQSDYDLTGSEIDTPITKSGTTEDAKPLINLINLTGKNGFTYYINVDKINSLTPTEYGVSISTSDNDGDYMVIDSIDEVLAKLGYHAS